MRAAVANRDSTSTAHVLRELEHWGAHRVAELRARIGPVSADWSVMGLALAQQYNAALARVSQKQSVLEIHVLALLSEPQGWHACPPGLTQLLADCAAEWMNQLEQLLDAVCTDAAILERTVRSGALGPLIAVDGWPITADAERPLQVAFASGKRFRVGWEDSRLRDRICRSMQELFSRVGERVGISRSACNLGRVWTEVPEFRPPSDDAAVDRLSCRFGVLLAAGYSLRVADCTPDDVVFRGDTPFLVSVGSVMRNEQARSIRDGVDRVLSDSVLATGLLSVASERDGARFGFAPLGHGSRSYVYEDRQEYDASGKPRIVSHALRASQPEHLKWLRPDAVAEGFRRGYHACQEDARDVFDGSWRGLRTAHAVRSRACYVETISAAEHPHNLGSTRQRGDAVRDRLLRLSPAGIPGDIIDAEISALLARRLPRFTTSPSSRRLHAPDRHAGAACFSHTGYQLAKQQHARMNPRDSSVQETLIRQALAPRKASSMFSSSRVDGSERPAAPDPNEFLLGAVAAGRWLSETAVRSNGSAGWFGLQQDDWGDCRIRPAGPDLYHGQAGIAAFLAYLGKATNCGEFMQLAAAGIRGARPALEDDSYWPGGGFSGRASLAFGALHVATLLHDHDLLSVVVRACRNVLAAIEGERVFDIVGGTAGAIAVALAVHRVVGQPELLDDALKAARHLIRSKVVDGPRCFWPTAMGPRGLTGFAHGSGGIAWSVSRLAELVRDQELRRLVAQALAFEDAAYVPRNGNWRDLRHTGGEAGAMGWCHGAPGIGMVRATLPARFFGQAEERDLRRAVRAVMTTRLTGNDSLCHGEMGNLETLILAGRRLRRRNLLSAARARAGMVLTSVLRDGTWRCGIGRDAATPGLMVGVAGIGFGFLRLWNPDAVPSLLTLDAPPMEC